MGTDVLKSYDSLQQELEKAKSHLQGLNENIRRIVGRDPQGTHLRGDRKRSFNDSRRSNDFNSGPHHDRSRNRDNRELSPTPSKRRPQEAKSVFSRLSGPPVRDDDNKPKIYSRVIRELPTRQEIVEAQGTDAASRARNRRMFGCLLGTLQKFCQEESRLKQKEEKKAQIERKLEEQEIQERENLKKERQNLFSDRKRQQLEVRKLELKMNYIREYEVWEKSRKELKNFIRTKTRPQIYFRPKVMTEKLEKRLAECQADLERELEGRRNKMNEEIQAIEDRYNSLADRTNPSADKLHATEETVSKHDRHDDEVDDDDSMYGGHSDDEQGDRIPSKVANRTQHNREPKERQHKDANNSYKLNDTIETNTTLDDTTLELEASQQFDDDHTENKRNSSHNTSTTSTNSGNKHDDKIE